MSADAGCTFFGSELPCFAFGTSEAKNMVASAGQSLSDWKADETRGTEI
jgi:hypothetical protein